MPATAYYSMQPYSYPFVIAPGTNGKISFTLVIENGRYNSPTVKWQYLSGGVWVDSSEPSQIQSFSPGVVGGELTLNNVSSLWNNRQYRVTCSDSRDGYNIVSNTTTLSVRTPDPTATPVPTSYYTIPWMNASEQVAVGGGRVFNLSWGTGCTRSPFCGSQSNELDIDSWNVDYTTDNGSTWVRATSVRKDSSHVPYGLVYGIQVRTFTQPHPGENVFFKVTGALSYTAPRGMVSVPFNQLNGNSPTATRIVPTGTPIITGTPGRTPMPTATIHPNAPAKVSGLYLTSYWYGGNNGLGNVAILKYKAYWQPLSDYPTPVSYYVIQRSDNNGLYWYDFLSTKWSVTGVDLFTDFQTKSGLLFRIRGANQFGDGPWSDPAGWFAANPTSTPMPSNTPNMRTPVPTATPVLTSTPRPTPLPTWTPEPTATPMRTATPAPTLMPTRAPNATIRPTATPMPTPMRTATPRPSATPTPTPPKKFNQAVFIDNSGNVTKQSVTPGQELQFKSGIVLGYAEDGNSGGDCWVCAQKGPVNIGPITSEKCLSVPGRSTTEQGLDCCQGNTYQTGSWSPSSKSCDLACRNISEICADSVNCGAFRCDQLCSWAVDPCDEPDCYENCSGAWCEGGCNQGTYGQYRSYVASLPPVFAQLVKPFNARYICGGDSAFTLKCPEPTPTAPSATQTPTPSSSSSSPYPSMLKSNHSSVSW